MGFEYPGFQEDLIEEKKEAFLDEEALFSIFSKNKELPSFLSEDQMQMFKTDIDRRTEAISNFKKENPEKFEKLDTMINNSSVEKIMKERFIESDSGSLQEGSLRVQQVSRIIKDIFLSDESEGLIKSYTWDEIIKIENKNYNQELKDIFIEAYLQGNSVTTELNECFITDPQKIEKIKLVVDAFQFRNYTDIDSFLVILQDENKKNYQNEEYNKSIKDVNLLKNKIEIFSSIREKFKANGMSFTYDVDSMLAEDSQVIQRINDKLDLIVGLDKAFSLGKEADIISLREFIKRSDEELDIFKNPHKLGYLQDIKNEFNLGVENFFEFEQLCSLSNKEIKNKESIKNLIDSFNDKDIRIIDFENIKEKTSSINSELEQIKKNGGWGLGSRELRSLVENSDDYKYFKEEFLRTLSRTKGDYAANVFSDDLLNYICFNQTINLYLLKNKAEISSRGFLDKKDSNNSLLFEKINNKFNSNNISREDLAFSKNQIKEMTRNENMGYLLLASALEIEFDYFGVNGKNIEEIKGEIDKKAKDIINDYEENKEKYWPYIESILGYANDKNKNRVNDLLKIKDLWNFKFDHIKDLKDIVDSVKDFKMKPSGEKEKKSLDSYINNLNEHILIEDFEGVNQRIAKIDEKNRDKANGLLGLMASLIKDIQSRKVISEKEFDRLLSNKNIFKTLGLGMTLDSISDYQKATKENKEDGGSNIESVEIIKNCEEYLSAMNIDPSCMRVGGGREEGALSIAQGPIMIIGVKNKENRIIGRSLLIPLKKGDGWEFELKRPYGEGGEAIAEFTEELKRKGLRVLESVNDGVLGKSKKMESAERLSFYRDGHGDTSIEMVE